MVRTVFPSATEEQARFFFRSIDLDKNGHIDLDEFTRFVDRQTRGPGEGAGLEMKEDSIRALFNAFDATGARMSRAGGGAGDGE